MVETFATGLRALRTAMLIYLVASVLISIFASVLAFMLLSKLSGAASSAGHFRSGLLADILAFVLIVAVVELIVLVLLRNGFMALRRKAAGIKIGVTGTLLQIIGSVLIFAALFIIIGFGSIVSSGGMLNAITHLGSLPIASTVAMIPGLILAVTGIILTLVGLWRIADIYENDLLKIGTILFIVPGLINFIGAILLYLGLGEAAEKEDASKQKKGQL